MWALPRALRAIQYSTNVLNPLHAWPTKASYEFRLIKYAFRGFAIAVPGIESVDVDLGKILGVPLSQLRGFARLVRMSVAFEDGRTVGEGADMRMPTHLTYLWGSQIGQMRRSQLHPACR